MEHNALWERYFYPGTNVLINNLGIKDFTELKIAEQDITSLTIAYCRENPVKGSFDLKHLCRIHKEIFGDLYPFAGELRDVEMAKSEPFTKALLIPTYSDERREFCKKIGFRLDNHQQN
jgi:cell filamentation protein